MVTIVDYKMGNTGSVCNALNALNVEYVVSSKKTDLIKASHIILPGVGSFGVGMQNLVELGLADLLSDEVLQKKKPFLGICLGMQLLAETGEEGGNYKGLGWIKGKTRKLKVDGQAFKLPHIGWNDVSRGDGGSTLFTGTDPNIFYFVHSFVLVPEEDEVVAATCSHGEVFTASVSKGNIYGVQFHPEKSQRSGLKILENFIKLKC